MKRKTRNIIIIAGSILGAGVIATSIAVPIVINSNKNTHKEIVPKDLFNEMITVSSAKSLDALLFKNSVANTYRTSGDYVEVNENVTYEQIKQDVQFDKNNFIYKQLLNDYDEATINNQISQTLFETYEEFKEEASAPQNARCGRITKKYYWEAIGMKFIAMGLRLWSELWWGIQLAAGVLAFVTTGDGTVLAEAFASFSGQLPDALQTVIDKGVTYIKNFKERTQCKFRFLVWNAKGTDGVWI